jgi:hypothetical protein
MDEDKLAQLREHYATADLAAEIERARGETDVDSDPMVTTSLRLPKSVLDWVRQQAEVEQVKPTALIRRWIEQQRTGRAADVSGRLERLVERLEVAVAAEETAPRTPAEAERKGWIVSVAPHGRWSARSPVSGREVGGAKKARRARIAAAKVPRINVRVAGADTARTRKRSVDVDPPPSQDGGSR